MTEIVQRLHEMRMLQLEIQPSTIICLQSLMQLIELPCSVQCDHIDQVHLIQKVFQIAMYHVRVQGFVVSVGARSNQPCFYSTRKWEHDLLLCAYKCKTISTQGRYRIVHRPTARANGIFSYSYCIEHNDGRVHEFEGVSYRLDNITVSEQSCLKNEWNNALLCHMQHVVRHMYLGQRQVQVACEKALAHCLYSVFSCARYTCQMQHIVDRTFQVTIKCTKSRDDFACNARIQKLASLVPFVSHFDIFYLFDCILYGKSANVARCTLDIVLETFLSLHYQVDEIPRIAESHTSQQEIELLGGGIELLDTRVELCESVIKSNRLKMGSHCCTQQQEQQECDSKRFERVETGSDQDLISDELVSSFSKILTIEYYSSEQSLEEQDSKRDSKKQDSCQISPRCTFASLPPSATI